MISTKASTDSRSDPAIANQTPSTATGTAPPTATRSSAFSRSPWARKSTPASTAANELKKAICRHSVARLTNSPAVNQRLFATDQSARVMNSVIGVFSRGPLEAYSMKPKKVRKAAAVTRPASLEANTSRPSTYTAHTHAVAMTMNSKRIVSKSSNPPMRAMPTPMPGITCASGPARLRMPRYGGTPSATCWPA